MKRMLLFGSLALLSVLTLLSCVDENLSHDMTIVNNSSREIGSVSLWYTGVKSPLPNFTIAVSVPVGDTKLVRLTLDSSTNYYMMQTNDVTLGSYIRWSQSAITEYVLLSKGGSSTCTITGSSGGCFAGENHVNPISYSW